MKTRIHLMFDSVVVEWLPVVLFSFFLGQVWTTFHDNLDTQEDC